MVNSDNLKEKLLLENKHNELKQGIDDVQGEIRELQEIRQELFQTLCKLDKKILAKESQADNLLNKLQEIDLVKELLYGRLTHLGDIYECSNFLSSECKTFLEKNGCKIEETSDNKCKIKRIILSGTKK